MYVSGVPLTTAGHSDLTLVMERGGLGEDVQVAATPGGDSARSDNAGVFDP
jgi:hypothetical protein